MWLHPAKPGLHFSSWAGLWSLVVRFMFKFIMQASIQVQLLLDIGQASPNRLDGARQLVDMAEQYLWPRLCSHRKTSPCLNIHLVLAGRHGLQPAFDDRFQILSHLRDAGREERPGSTGHTSLISEKGLLRFREMLESCAQVAGVFDREINLGKETIPTDCHPNGIVANLATLRKHALIHGIGIVKTIQATATNSLTKTCLRTDFWLSFRMPGTSSFGSLSRTLRRWASSTS